MPHVLPNPNTYSGRSFVNERGNAECVEFIKQTLNAPRTVLWREGVKIAPAEGAQTTTIATFVQGRYPQVGNTGMHAAIYIGQNAQGIQVLDQWRAQGRVMPRTIPWKPRRPGLSNDGSAFSVIEW